MEQFDLLELDFQVVYGIDLSGHVRTQDGWVRVMEARSARWFVWRVHGLSGMPSSRWSTWLKRDEGAGTDDDVPDEGTD